MLLINLGGLGLIVLIIWWFWLYAPAASNQAKNDLIIVVENGIYSPSRLILPAGIATTVTFIRKDPSPCSETVLIPSLQLNENLPLDKAQSIDLPPLEKGEYSFHCQMQMYRGVMIVQ
jgi:plastocyanin domain-containing protein